MDDMTLLREYAARNSEAAFETLVSRRIGFVYSAALRQVRDPLLAGEITQVVFIILAQKAGRISEKTILTGWFFRTTRFTALAQMRADAKRRRRELEVQMQSEFQSPAADEIWNQMSPLLDEALATLGEKDRQAVLLRFFENKSLAEVGNVLGTGEDTARKRVARALEKLHRHFKKRGVNSTTAIIAGEISANSIQAAPAALAKSVTIVALAKGAAAAGGSTLALVKGALKMMAWMKAKTAIVVGVGTAMLLAGGAVSLTLFKEQNKSQPNEASKYILELITNCPPVITQCPPITDLVFKYTFGKDATELYRFHYQSNAFYVRKTKDSSFKGDFALEDVICGCWADDYWSSDGDYWSYIYHQIPNYKNVPPPPPLLNESHFDSKDTYSTAYVAVNRYLLSSLRLFTTLGIAGDNAPSLIYVDKDNNIVYKTLGFYKGLRQEITTTVNFDYSNSLPMRAILKTTAPDGKISTQYIGYRYNPDIAGGRIPAYIDGGYFSIEVMSLSFGQNDMPLSKDYFNPPKSLLAMNGLCINVHSNLTEYVFASNGRLVSQTRDSQSDSDRIRASQAATEALRSGISVDQAAYSPARHRYALKTIGILAIIFIVFVLQRKYRYR